MQILYQLMKEFPKNLIVGAERIDRVAVCKGKRIAVVANQASMVSNTHLVDTLLSLQVDIKRIFTPEHGFRGKADAGAKVESQRIDSKTNLALISLYGNNKKPSADQLKDVDLIIFDHRMLELDSIPIYLRFIM